MNLFIMEVIPNVFEKYVIEISVFGIIARIIMNNFVSSFYISFFFDLTAILPTGNNFAE